MLIEPTVICCADFEQIPSKIMWYLKGERKLSEKRSAFILTFNDTLNIVLIIFNSHFQVSHDLLTSRSTRRR